MSAIFPNGLTAADASRVVAYGLSQGLLTRPDMKPSTAWEVQKMKTPLRGWKKRKRPELAGLKGAAYAKAYQKLLRKERQAAGLTTEGRVPRRKSL